MLTLSLNLGEVTHARNKGGGFDLAREAQARGWNWFNFGNSDAVRQEANGPGRVLAANDTIGLVIDQGPWGSQMLDQYLAGQPEAIRNTSGAGAAAGSPGSLPTNWVANTPWEVVGTGVEDGIPYVDIRFAGSGSLVHYHLNFEQPGIAAAAVGQAWAFSAALRLVAGSLTNVSLPRLVIAEASSSGTILSGLTTANSIDLGTSSLASASAGGTLGLTAPTCASVSPQFFFTASGPYDFTLRIGRPSLKRAALNSGQQATTSFRSRRQFDPAAYGPELSANTPDASGTTAGMSTSADSVIDFITEAQSPSPSGKAFRLANAQASNRFANIEAPGVVSGRTYEITFWARSNSTRQETFGFAEAGAPTVTINLTTAWRRYTALLTASADNQAYYIRAAAGQTTVFVLNSIREVTATAPVSSYDGIDDRQPTGLAPSPGANFMMAKFRVPLELGEDKVVVGSTDSDFSSIFQLAVNNGNGRVGGGIRGVSFNNIQGGPDVRGQTVIAGLSMDDQGNGLLFVNDTIVWSGSYGGTGLLSPVPITIGARNTDTNNPSRYWSGTIEDVIFGFGQAADLELFRRIAAQL